MKKLALVLCIISLAVSCNGQTETKDKNLISDKEQVTPNTEWEDLVIKIQTPKPTDDKTEREVVGAKMIEEQSFFIDNGRKILEETKIITFDENGNMISFNHQGKGFHRIKEITYNDKGRVSDEINELGKIRYEYNEKGMRIKEYAEGDYNNGAYTYFYNYDPNNRVVRIIKRADIPTEDFSSEEVNRYYYNAQWQLIKTRYGKDSDLNFGDLALDKDFAIESDAIFKYDKNGRISSFCFRPSNTVLCDRYEYNTYGDPIKFSNRDGKNTFTYEYNNRGDWVKRTEFNDWGGKQETIRTITYHQ